MSAELRRQVLNAFKSLHRTRQLVFNGDKNALEQARIRINREYKNCKTIADRARISGLIQYSKAVENELKTTVIQAKQIGPDRYQAEIRRETVKLDNVPFRDCHSK